jgi:hypothetical protein
MIFIKTDEKEEDAVFQLQKLFLIDNKNFVFIGDKKCMLNKYSTNILHNNIKPYYHKNDYDSK